MFPMSERVRDAGILFMRVGMGAMFLGHGVPKLLGGQELWAKLGAAMANVGITFAPTFWGFMAGFAEAVGGLCLILGLLMRPMALMLAFTMAMAALSHHLRGDGFKGWSHATEAGIVFLALVLIGPGRYALDHLILRRGDGAPPKAA